MKSFEEWWSESGYQYGQYEDVKAAWKAALEWVLNYKELKDIDYSGEPVEIILVDFIEEELDDSNTRCDNS